jgi:hypothetical protein
MTGMLLFYALESYLFSSCRDIGGALYIFHLKKCAFVMLLVIIGNYSAEGMNAYMNKYAYKYTYICICDSLIICIFGENWMLYEVCYSSTKNDYVSQLRSGSPNDL